jgi:hypothetical protein
MNETHNGNLNRSKVPATGVEGLKSTGKSNGTEATLRKGNLPKASAVTTVDRDANKGKAIKAAQKQNTSDEKSWPHGRNVIPQSGDNAVLTHDQGGE